MTHKRLSRRSFIETSVLGTTVGAGIGIVSTVGSSAQNNQIIPVTMRVLGVLGITEDELKGSKQTALKKFYNK